MIQAGFYEEDCLVYDLEDSVPAAEKDSARFLVYNALRFQRPKDKYIVVRVNGIYSEYIDEDLEAIVRARPDAIRIPKVEYARNAVLLACREAGIDALDVVFSNINDMEGLEEDAAVSRNLGFDGKTVIHPRQIDVVNACFAPSEKEIRYALRVLETLEEGKRRGKGVITLDGSMLDKPMELREKATLKKAKAAGMYVGGGDID